MFGGRLDVLLDNLWLFFESHRSSMCFHKEMKFYMGVMAGVLLKESGN